GGWGGPGVMGSAESDAELELPCSWAEVWGPGADSTSTSSPSPFAGEAESSGTEEVGRVAVDPSTSPQAFSPSLLPPGMSLPSSLSLSFSPASTGVAPSP